jgi:hypothetical protein
MRVSLTAQVIASTLKYEHRIPKQAERVFAKIRCGTELGKRPTTGGISAFQA